MSTKEKNDLRNQIAALQDELRREKERVDIKAANKKLLRLQNERKQQDTVIKNLEKAIDGFKDKMLQYETEKLGVDDKSEAQRRKELLEKQTHQEEISKLNAKVRTVETQKNKATEELTELKVRMSEKDQQLQAMKLQKDEQYTK